MTDIQWSSIWVAQHVQTSLDKQPSWDNQPFDAGEMITDGERNNYIDLTDPNAQTVQADYLKALSELPIAGNSPTLDRNVFGLAQDWYLGFDPSGTGTLGDGFTCGVPAGTGLQIPSPNSGSFTVDAQQLSNAAAIVHTGQSLKIPQQGLVIAVMAALTESEHREPAQLRPYPVQRAIRTSSGAPTAHPTRRMTGRPSASSSSRTTGGRSPCA